jgi:hypothetical protein
MPHGFSAITTSASATPPIEKLSDGETFVGIAGTEAREVQRFLTEARKRAIVQLLKKIPSASVSGPLVKFSISGRPTEAQIVEVVTALRDFAREMRAPPEGYR